MGAACWLLLLLLLLLPLLSSAQHSTATMGIANITPHYSTYTHTPLHVHTRHHFTSLYTLHHATASHTPHSTLHTPPSHSVLLHTYNLHSPLHCKHCTLAHACCILHTHYTQFLFQLFSPFIYFILD